MSFREIRYADEWYVDSLQHLVGKTVSKVWDDALDFTDGTEVVFLARSGESSEPPVILAEWDYTEDDSKTVSRVYATEDSIQFEPVATLRIVEEGSGIDYGIETKTYTVPV